MGDQKEEVTAELSRLCHGQSQCSLMADPRSLGVPACLDLHVYLKTTYVCVDMSVFLPRYLLNTDQQLVFESTSSTTTPPTTTTRRTTTTTSRPTTSTTTRSWTTTTSTMRKRPPSPEIEWWGSEGLKRGGAAEEEEEHQADSIYRGGEWLEGVSGRRVVAGPPLVKRVESGDGAADRIPDIVTGVVMTYSFMQVLFSLVLLIIIFSCSFLPVPCSLLSVLFPSDLLF
jgi:hypothetical protein